MRRASAKIVGRGRRHPARPWRRLRLESYATPMPIVLALFQLAGFATCAWLLATRDRSTLLASENRSIGRLAVGALDRDPLHRHRFPGAGAGYPGQARRARRAAGRHRGPDRGQRHRDAAAGHSDDGAAAFEFRAARRRRGLRVAGCRRRAGHAILRHRDRGRADDRPDDRYAARLVRIPGAGRAEFGRGVRRPEPATS